MKILLLFMIFIVLGGLIMCTQMTELLPKEIDGWTISQPDQIYDRKNLYDYIDGGAELYLSYGFKEVYSRTYHREDQPEIIVDMFEMGNSYNAYGIFSHSRETVDSTFGQGSQYTAGLLLFWKDHYYISILASPETEHSKGAMFRLASIITERIPEEGALPAVLDLLPRQGLVEESLRYFRHHSWLNAHYFIAQENILQIDDRTDAVLAKYDDSGYRHYLLLVKYATVEDASAAHQSFAMHYLPALAIDSIVQIKDGSWTGCRIDGQYLTAVFNAPDRESALRLLSRTADNIHRTIK